MDRLAFALAKLWDQVKVTYPNRATDSDGWIASSAHHAANPSSDHEPDSRGIVHALDLTHDPVHGFDSYSFADWLLSHKDPRIKYIISNRRIGGDEGYAQRNGRKPWTWYPYNGENPHTAHVHVSCNKGNEDDDYNWELPPVNEPAQTFIPVGSGKGSWYSQFEGQYSWVDKGDRPNSNALGVPDSRQGFAMLDRATLGTWRQVRAPNGVVLKLQQTDIGPSATTGRAIDIAAVAAEHFGYSPKNFPTDSIFEWGAIIDAPIQNDGILRRETHIFNPSVQHVQQLLGFSDTEQDGYYGSETEKAVKWFQRREGLIVDGEVGPNTIERLEGGKTLTAPATSDPLTKVLTEILAILKPALEKNMPNLIGTAVVPIASAWVSKINWTQIVAMALSAIVAANPADILQFINVTPDPSTKMAIILGIQGAQSLATWVLRTYFNGSVSPGSLPK